MESNFGAITTMPLVRSQNKYVRLIQSYKPFKYAHIEVMYTKSKLRSIPFGVVSIIDKNEYIVILKQSCYSV